MAGFVQALKNALGLLLNPRSHLSKLGSLTGNDQDIQDGGSPAGSRRTVRLKDVVFNLPLVIGGLIVLALFLVVLFGPVWAPYNPYIAGEHIVTHYDAEKDVWISPPLEPSAEYPLGTDEWGNDILSLLLYGARNTLVACAFITMVRVLLGLILGALAGWNEGSLTDQTVMGAIGVITSVPMLISSMLLIFALDIRRGLPVFIVALAIIGWTEIAQYIRSEFFILRKMPYVEGARAVGTRSPAIAIRHLLPNLLPQLLVITFLEMGAVLMLLGELGFVGVFIGGGSRVIMGDEMVGTQILTLSEVPEWGAMLAEGYLWLRAKPFIVYPPAIAFFIAVLGLNAFGEGLRRLIESVHVNTNFLLRKRMILAIAGLTFATVFIINNTGPAPWFARVARAFDVDAAFDYTQALAAMDGRGAGQRGGTQAADFITAAFQDSGLKPGWRQSTYIYPLTTQLVRPLSQPELAILGADGQVVASFLHQQDFGFMIEGHGGSGDATYPVTYVGFEERDRDYDWESFQGLDLRNRIIMLMADSAPADFADEALIRGAKGVLWITEGGAQELRSQIQLADAEKFYMSKPTFPVFRITFPVAQVILEQAGLAASDLFQPDLVSKDQTGAGWFTQDLNVKVHMALSLSEPEATEIPCVLGFMPGSDFDLTTELVVLYANYDGLGKDPDGTVYQGVNENASGVGVLLELARLWQEQELNPRRSVLFVAWGGGTLENPGIKEFLNEWESFRHLPNMNSTKRLEPHIIFQINGAGVGESPLFIHPSSSNRLVSGLKEAAEQIGMEVVEDRQGAPVVDLVTRISGVDWISFKWSNSDRSPRDDRIEEIDPEKLRSYGEALSLALTRVVRETRYY
ncbi:MAG: ABC transporter permease subunit [Anaerolineales bacterium]